MTTFISRFDTSGPGIRLAVKDLIDMAGVPTTAGCRAVADTAVAASSDAACLAGARAAGARIVGRTNLHELAFGVTGINPWFGTPVNPLDPTRVPGGSSSGSAVAVATGEADVAFGSDTGGSVRIPAACCGVAGLKTTWGRIPLDGVWPLAPSFDTVGPMALDVQRLEAGMALLEPGFSSAPPAPWRVGRLRVDADADIDAAIDRALAATGWEVVDIPVPEWESVTLTGALLLAAEAWDSNRLLAERHPDGIGADVLDRLHLGRDTSDQVSLSAAGTAQALWCSRLDAVLRRVDFLALPTLTIFPPVLDDARDLLVARCTLPVNLAGVPALCLPVPASGPLPASLQLIGPRNSEETIVAAGKVVEAAVG
ncbi:MAG: amidase [Acidimicrobiales bacterium]